MMHFITVRLHTMIKLYNRKIAIISDIHLGVHSDSPIWHKLHLDYADWLVKELNDKSINDILILGDIFNDRQEIGVNTLQIAHEFFDKFKNFNIITLLGNHDIFLKNSCDISSLSIFKGWNNIQVIDKQTLTTNFGKNLLLCPWEYDLSKVQGNVDYMFGHFEINNFRQTMTKVCDTGINSDILLDKSNLIFSGHFHLRDERDYKNGRIIYVGCPLSLNFGDAGTTKGYYTFDISTGKYDFIENTVSPRHYYILLSDLFNKEKVSDIKKCIPNNFIKLVVDKELEYDKFNKIIVGLTGLKPIELTNNFRTTTEISVAGDYDAVNMDIKSLLEEFITNIDTKADKNKILLEVMDLYEKSLNKVKIYE